MLVKNEEIILPICLKTISWVDQIIVIGDEPTEKVLKIAKEAGAKIYLRKLDNFASQRNFALSKAETDWVLLIDPDEEVPSDLADEIIKAVIRNEFDGYRFPRKNIIFGKQMEHTGWYPDYQTHLFKTKKGKYVGKIHEQVEIDGKIGDLVFPLLHNNYQTISQYLDKNFKYTSLEAERKINAGYKFNWSYLISKPMNEFLRRYFAEEGYKDGIHGLALSLLQSFMELLVYIKIWEQSDFTQGPTPEVFDHLDQAGKDLDFWIASKSNNPIRKILHKFK